MSIGRPAVPLGSPSSLAPTWAVDPGSPATKAQQLCVACACSARMRSRKAFASSVEETRAKVAMKRERRMTSSTR